MKSIMFILLIMFELNALGAMTELSNRELDQSWARGIPVEQMFGEELYQIFNHDEIILADNKLDMSHFAEQLEIIANSLGLDLGDIVIVGANINDNLSFNLGSGALQLNGFAPDHIEKIIIRNILSNVDGSNAGTIEITNFRINGSISIQLNP